MTLPDGTTDSAMSLTKEYFNREAVRFRKIMGDKRNAIETIQRALEGLFLVYLNIKPSECDENTQISFAAIMEEWSRRSALMLMNGHPIEATTNQFFAGE